MLQGGLVSITFRQLSPEEIISLVCKSGLKGIEWGGDIHVPHGNLSIARNVGAMTREEGLEVAAYGSYYRVGCEGQDGIPDFKDVLETALELGAPLIRVWAGDRGSDKADQGWWDKVVEDSKRIGGMAQKEGVKIAYEYHGNTLTDTLESVQKLMEKVNHPNVRSYWQPLPHHDMNSRLEGLKQVLPWLENIHVFYWISHERYPLEDGTEDWAKYLELVKNLEGQRYAMIEFVKDNKPEQFLWDAEILKNWLQGVRAF
jgi:sugar phosphate isomerase/epimerase